MWLGLHRRGEYGNSSGGLLRWDRNTNQIRQWKLRSEITSLARSGDTIYMGCPDGIAALREDRIASYFVDQSAGGQYQIASR